METYYIENSCPSFLCPSPQCQQQFKVPREWLLHAIDVCHNISDLVPPGEQLQTWFAQHNARLARMEQQDETTLNSMRALCGEQGSQQRREAEDAFLYQLEHDPLYAQREPPRERLVWCDYMQEMDGELIIR